MSQPEKGRWYNLGMLIGGHTEVDDGRRFYPVKRPYVPDTSNDDETAGDLMDAAGLTPTVRYPGTWTTPWKCLCNACGLVKDFTVQAVIDGARCSHELNA
ncbi:hypothetical protein [Streptomyces sp. NPDC004267]|uniref:hypothetical protein n=1 Tax=Streptomyces sp. NPDC004267 TaxID=3364694 RepID=UPI00367B79DE